MAGRPGRSGGHNKLSLEQHWLRGTYNATRHGPRPPVLTLSTAARHEPLPADVGDGLSGRGLAFAQELWQQYSGWNPAARALLREAGILLSQLELLRGTSDERAAQRLLLSVIQALRLEDA